eukprot:COSAG06_NODE_9090_length_1989_cov_4.921456_3_plen_110_part_00
MQARDKHSENSESSAIADPQDEAQEELLSCTHSEECRTPPRDRSYCYKGQCVGGGGVLFDPAIFLGQNGSSTYSELQTGVLGGHLRVASVGAYDNATQVTNASFCTILY